MKLSDLSGNPRNPRKITDEKLAILKKALHEFGDLSGIVYNQRTKQIVGGHQRLKVLPLDAEIILHKVYQPPTRTGTVAEGFAEIDGEQFKFRQVDWDEAREKAANIAANKHGGEWELPILSEWLLELDAMNFDMDLTGFDSAELENLMAPVEQIEGECDPDETPEPPAEPVTKRGDIYQLGRHRLMCGDSTMIDEVQKLMDGNKADLIHTDPPYNVDYSNQDRPKSGKIDHGRIENDSMTSEEFKDFLFKALSNAYLSCKEDATAYIWYASKESINFMAAAQEAGWDINQQIIWKKPMLLGRGRYQWAHEPCLFAIKGKPWFTDDRTKTTVWDFGGYDKSKNVHPTQKPVFLPEEAIANSSKIGSNVLDLFGGSGSTLIAAEKTSRNCFTMEMDPRFCDVIVARWEKFTGKKAELLTEEVPHS